MRKNPYFILASAVALIVATLLLLNHLNYAAKLTNLAVLHALLFVHFSLKLLGAVAAKPHRPDPKFNYAGLDVDIVVPIYNEDPALLAAGVRSFAAQTRKPRAVWLVDDGSNEPVLETPEVTEAVVTARAAGIDMRLHRQANAGKRWAQSHAFAQSDADIFITVDSDTVLEPDGVEKIIIPFSRDDVFSVAGLATGQNYRANLLTRAVDLTFTMAFVQGRTAEGCFGSVRVNCGIFAAYRGAVCRDNLHRYLNQRFLGAPVKAGDDRALTCFAKERGRAESQPEAVAYSALPARLSHLVRQRMRWARSWVWGTFWLLRRPILSADFAFTITQLISIFAFGAALTIYAVGGFSGAVSLNLFLMSMLTAIGIGYASHLRYVVVAHRRDSVWQRVFTWLLSPLSTVLALFLTMPLYYRAMLRPRPQQVWGTRKSVEVGLHAKANNVAIGSTEAAQSTEPAPVPATNGAPVSNGVPARNGVRKLLPTKRLQTRPLAPAEATPLAPIEAMRPDPLPITPPAPQPERQPEPAREPEYAGLSSLFDGRRN